jgi:hypothetical protein
MVFIITNISTQLRLVAVNLEYLLFNYIGQLHHKFAGFRTLEFQFLRNGSKKNFN